MRGWALIPIVVLAACGPIPVAQAEAECFERARLAAQPRGTIHVGVNSNGGTYLGGEIGVSTDYLQGRDPSQVYDQCVFQRSGQMPSRPLYTRSDWQ
jgi:hypothetical protein